MICLGPKRLLDTLKTQFFEKKATFSVMKKVWPISSRFIEREKPHGTTYKGQKGKYTLTVEVVRRFLEDLRGC